MGEERHPAGEWLPPQAPGAAPPPVFQPPPPQPPPPPGDWAPPAWPPVAGGPPAYYPTASPATGPGNGDAIAGFVLAIAALAVLFMSAGIAFFISLPCAILGWIFGARGLRRVERGETVQHRSLAKAGQVMGIVGVVLAILGAIFWILLFALGHDTFRHHQFRPDNGIRSSIGLRVPPR